MYIAGQIVGVFVTIAAILSLQFKEMKHILAMQVLANTLLMLNYWLLDAFSGASIALIATVQTVIMFVVRMFENKMPKKLNTILTVIITAVFAFIFIFSAVKTYKAPVEVFAMFLTGGLTSLIRWWLATDTGCVTDEIRESMLGCQSVLIESNHDLDMLLCGPYPPELKKRILSRRGHLSNPDCAAFAAELASKGTKTFLLGHLSEENNSPSAALETVRGALAGFADVSVIAAKPDCETVVV